MFGVLSPTGSPCVHPEAAHFREKLPGDPMKKISFLGDLLLQLSILFNPTTNDLGLCTENVFSRSDGMLKVNY